MRQFLPFNLVGLALFFVLIVGCSFGQSKTQLKSSTRYDLEYLGDQAVDTIQKLNLALPVGKDDYPLLIWIGGGAWSYVDRNVEMDLAERFAEEGIAVASIGHRLSAAQWRDSTLNTGVQHPAHVQDVAAAIKWLYDKAADYGYDKQRLFIGGFSSGAHLAALIGLDTRYLQKVGLSQDVIKGMIPISGAFDIVNYREVFVRSERPELAELHVDAVFGTGQEAHINASPTAYLENLEVPILLIADNAVDRYTRYFVNKLKKTNFTKYKAIYVSDLNHADLWRNISGDAPSQYRKIMVDFIKSNSKMPK